jgi:hypothetical protein
MANKKKYVINDKCSSNCLMTPFGTFLLSEKQTQANLKKLYEFGFKKEISIVEEND